MTEALTNSDNHREWSRTPAAKALLVAALALSLVLGGLFLRIEHRGSSARAQLEHPVDPISDDLTAAQVVESARQIVTVAGLQHATAGYTLLSCKNEHDPPYQGAIYMHFALPADAHADTYFRKIAAAMMTKGWDEGLPPSQHVYGKTVYRDGVTAVFYREGDSANLGVMRLYGQCRNVNNHRADETAWIDITDQLTRTR